MQIPSFHQNLIKLQHTKINMNRVSKLKINIIRNANLLNQTTYTVIRCDYLNWSCELNDIFPICVVRKRGNWIWRGVLGFDKRWKDRKALRLFRVFSKIPNFYSRHYANVFERVYLSFTTVFFFVRVVSNFNGGMHASCIIRMAPPSLGGARHHLRVRVGWRNFAFNFFFFFFSFSTVSL